MNIFMKNLNTYLKHLYVEASTQKGTHTNTYVYGVAFLKKIGIRKVAYNIQYTGKVVCKY